MSEQFFNQRGSLGWIEVICGSMFSGKTEELIRRLVRAARHSGRRVIDVGTGSGVLAIAAVKLGWGPVRGYDHEAAAIEAAAITGDDAVLSFSTSQLVAAPAA